MSPDSRVSIRLAREEETGLLSELAMRSKGYWGYDAAFLEACRDELTVSSGRLAAGTVWVAYRGDEILGFSALGGEGDDVELTDLFVDPDHIGQGVGRALWDHTVEEGRRRGIARFRIEADPHAEAWYLRRGSVRVGEVPSGSIPGRMLPLLRYEVT